MWCGEVTYRGGSIPAGGADGSAATVCDVHRRGVVSLFVLVFAFLPRS